MYFRRHKCDNFKQHSKEKKTGKDGRKKINKAGYTAQDAPSRRLKITQDRWTYGPTDGRTDTPSYRDATAHLKRRKPVENGDEEKPNGVLLKLTIIG